MREYRLLTSEEIPMAWQLAKETFFATLEEEVQTAFDSFLEAQLKKAYSFYGAFEDELLGVIIYEENHYTLNLFCAREQEIYEQLWNAFQQYCFENGVGRIYANILQNQTSFYEELGFRKLEDEITNEIPISQMEYLFGIEYLGKQVHVTVDQTYGSLHPHYPDVYYPCNVGYIEELFHTNGQFQDAYVVGIEEARDTCEGFVVGIIYRKESIQSIWIVNPTTTYEKQEIIDTIGILEQHYETQIVWL